MDHNAKRSRRLSDQKTGGCNGTEPEPSGEQLTLQSLGRAITPPRKKTRRIAPEVRQPKLEEGPAIEAGHDAVELGNATDSGSGQGTESESEAPLSERARQWTSGQAMPAAPKAVADFSSPFRLTHIRDLGAQDNVDAVKLEDVVGDPLISECWDFNYLHDVDFLIGALDEDVRGLVKVNVVHGFWKKDDPRRLALQENAARHKNVTLHAAFMPEMFGTHHSKMLILLRHDDTAQVVIHTANMIPKDWTNMTQSIWISPRLPRLTDGNRHIVDYRNLPEGSGEKFKADLLSYLRAYDVRRTICQPLVRELQKHDFSSVRGTLIASVPGRHKVHDASTTAWGWAAVKRALRSVPLQEAGTPEVVVQISSIATLGPTDTWLRGTLFDALAGGKTPRARKPRFKVVFPTPDEIRRSLDGYSSGGSIHTKIQSAQQKKQLLYLKPLFCHWANDSPDGMERDNSVPLQDSGRRRAAPHVKTYIRYGDSGSLDWALMTSANLSKQAWGDATNATGEFRVASWEIGVMVWPSLFADNASMRTVFRRDLPSPEDRVRLDGRPIVGLRIPYSLPVQRYGKDEIPWVATSRYTEPDWKGQTWEY